VRCSPWLIIRFNSTMTISTCASPPTPSTLRVRSCPPLT
jgi:hypothetical protein